MSEFGIKRIENTESPLGRPNEEWEFLSERPRDPHSVEMSRDMNHLNDGASGNLRPQDDIQEEYTTTPAIFLDGMLSEEADRRASVHEEISGEYGLVVDASTINQMEECVGNHAGRLTELENVISTIQTRLNDHLRRIISLVSENRPQTTRKLESALCCVSSEVKNIAVQIAALGVGDFAAQMATISQIQSRLGAHASQLQDQFNKIQSDVQMQTRELEALGSKQSEMKATLGRHIANLDCDLDTYHKELQQVRDSQKRTDERLQKFLKTQSDINDRLMGNIGIVSDKLTETKTKTSQSSINAELNKAIGKQREGLFSIVNNVQNIVEDLSKFKRVQRSVNTDASNNLTQLQNTVAKISSNIQKTIDNSGNGT